MTDSPDRRLRDVVASPVDSGDPPHPDFVFLRDWWEQARAGRVGPAREEIDPVELKPVLAKLTLVEYEPSDGSFRFRLAGTEIFHLHNREIAYSAVNDFEPQAYRDLLNEHYSDVIRTGAPNAWKIDFITVDGMQRQYVSLRLPLSTDGVKADGIITLDVFGEGWRDLEPWFARLYDDGDGA